MTTPVTTLPHDPDYLRALARAALAAVLWLALTVGSFIVYPSPAALWAMLAVGAAMNPTLNLVLDARPRDWREAHAQRAAHEQAVQRVRAELARDAEQRQARTEQLIAQVTDETRQLDDAVRRYRATEVGQ